MDVREPDSPYRDASQSMLGGHGPFAFFNREAGFSLMGCPPSIIAPTATRHSGNLANPACNLPPNLNLNPDSNRVVPNLNPNAISNPSQSSSAFLEASSPPAQTPPLSLVVNTSERSSLETLKKKRGRPRKYMKDENGNALIIPQSPKPLGSQKKRKTISVKKSQLIALGPFGQSFACHVLIVAAGEDVSTKIITFTSQGRWAVCVLSANGAISNATLQHAGVSGGAVTYEGRFEILSLSGSFLPTESNGTRSRTGGLSVSLAGPDGRVIGGGVAGLLMAGSPVQVVVGTFFRETSRNIGSDGEGNSLFKSPNMSGAKLQLPSIQQGNIGIEDALDHNMCSGMVTASEEQSRAYHVSLPPVHSLHCGGSQFPADGCDNNDNISTSRSEQ